MEANYFLLLSAQSDDVPYLASLAQPVGRIDYAASRMLARFVIPEVTSFR